MKDINYYRKINGTYASQGGRRDSNIKYTQDVLFQNVLHHPNCQRVKFVNEDDYDDVIIVSDRENNKLLIRTPGKDVDGGNMVNWNNSMWLCVLKDEDETIYSKGIIQRCNQTLKWQDDDNVIHTTPCILSDKTSVYSDGLSKTEFISLGTDQISIVVQANEETLKIPLNKRFIFQHDKNNIYEVNRRDTLTLDGLISLVVKKSQHSEVYDNLELNLANYNGKKPEEADPESQELKITGVDEFNIWKKNVEYGINTDENVTWSLSRSDIVKFTKVDGNKCYLQCVDTNKIGKFTLKATVGDIVIEKNISLVYQ